MSGPGESPAPRADTKSKARGAMPYVAASGLVRMAMSIVSLFLLVRYLPQEQYGAWILIRGLTLPMGLFTSLGFRQSMLRFMPALPIEGSERALMLWHVVGRRFAVVVLATIGLVMVHPWIPERFGISEFFLTFLAILPAIVFYTTNIYTLVGLDVQFRQREVFIARFVEQMVILVGVGVGILLEQPLVFFAAVYSLAGLSTSLISLRNCFTFFGPPKVRYVTEPREESAEEQHYRRTSWADDILTSLLSSDLSRYVLAAASTSPEVAIFGVATAIVDRLQQFMPIEIFRPLATVSIFERYELTGEIEELNKMFRFVYSSNLLVTFFYISLFASIGAEALSWAFQDKYQHSYWPVLFLFVGLGPFAVPLGLVAQTLRRPQVLIYSKVSVVLNLGLGIPLSYQYGSGGMAATMAVSILARNVIIYALLRREFAVRIPWSVLARYGLTAVVTAISVLLLKEWIPFLVLAVVGPLIYFVAARTFGTMNAWERSFLVSLFPERMRGGARLVIGVGS